jgi:hypothetical protein
MSDISLAFVPLAAKARIYAKDVAADIARKWPDFPDVKPEEGNPGQLSFETGGLSVIAQYVPRPIPWGDLEEPCQTSMLWEDAEEELRDHAGHMIVTTFGDAEPLDRMKFLTVVLAGMLGACDKALGVYWGGARLVVPSKLFQDMAKDILPDGLPLFIWIGFRAGKNDDGTTSGFTTGLRDLGHREFETDNATDSVGTLRERLFNLSCYVLENGPVIKDGNTVGADESEKIRVVYSESLFGNEGEVMRLDYQTGRKKKNRRYD